ncbi:hypothetical protein DFJ73DRAFT_175178 [Zopfochytrium polystomum]|nr:hypothetical protein DFJ73DRAFT_175178 [Zopfochytrium polystomum]
MREFIAAKEREWIKGTVSQEDDYEGLFFQATRGWAVWNAPPKDLKAYGFGRSDSYKYDFFISYRVASESYLARELRLRLIKLNYKVFLDQENLKDGENWQTGFVTGLKSSRVVLLLVSAAALEPRRVARSVSAVDNVLLEWETAMAAATFGFCAVLPIYVGSGVIDISKYPKDRFKLVERNPGTELFCRQSAFTTLRRLQSIGMRLSLPNPARGFTDDHIGKIAATLKGFNLTFDVTQPKKALLYFQELGEKIFGQEPGGSISKAWFCKDCRIEPVFGDKFSKFHLVMKHNNAWKNFNVSRQVRESGADTGLSALILDDIRKKEPETLTFACTLFRNTFFEKRITMLISIALSRGVYSVKGPNRSTRNEGNHEGSRSSAVDQVIELFV